MARLPSPRWLGIGDLEDSDSFFALGLDFYSMLFDDFQNRLDSISNDFLEFTKDSWWAYRKKYEKNKIKFAGESVVVPRPAVRPYFWVYQNKFAELCLEYVNKIYAARDSALKRQAEFPDESQFVVAVSYWEEWVSAVFRVLDYATFWVFKVWEIHFKELTCVSTALKIQFKPNYKATKQVGWDDDSC